VSLVGPRLATPKGDRGSRGRRFELRQIAGQRSAITAAELKFRRAAETAGMTSLSRARQQLPGAYEQMLDRVEVAVAEEPLPPSTPCAVMERRRARGHHARPPWHRHRDHLSSRPENQGHTA
jgi:hypothetical protein